MQREDEVRKEVSQAYAKAVTRPREGRCCCGPEPQGVAAKLAGYQAEELEGIPQNAVTHAFGCGDPVALSGVREGDVVVDLGSGAGIDVLLAARKVGPEGRAIGVDMTGEMIARARENIAASGLTNAEVREGLIEELPVEASTADWVISNCVINLSPEKPRVFAEIARVLKPGGRMLVSDIVVNELPEWVLEIPELRSACVAGAVSEEEYLAGLREAGLVDVEVRSRLTYEASQLRALIGSDLSCTDEAVAEWARSAGHGKVDELARELAGRVSSIAVSARKPG